MAATWPTSLPSYVATDGYQREPAPNAVFSETVSGRVKSRRKALSRQHRQVFAFHLSAAQLTTFETFWRDTLRDGALPFQGILDPITGDNVVWQPMGAFTVSPVASTLLRMQLPLARTDDAPFDSQTVSVELDGAAERLASSEATVGIADTWTLVVWAKRSDSDTVERRLAEIYAAANSNNRIVVARQAGTSDALEVSVYSSAGTLIKQHRVTAMLPRNQWRCIAVAFDGSEASDPLRVYVNGGLLTPTSTPTNTTGSLTDTARAIAVGRSGFDFAGRVHSLGLWSSELAAAEVASIYYGGRDFDWNAAKNGYASPATLQHWYRLGHDATPDADIGRDFAAAPFGAHNLTSAAAGITAADVVADSPA